MNSVLVLVDLANSSVFRGVHNPNPPLVGGRLDDYITSLADKLEEFVAGNFPEFRVRLYDGWFDAQGYGSDLYRMVRAHVRGSYPTRKRRYRLFVDLAEAPLAVPGERLIDTYRVQSGLTRYHVAVMDTAPAACAIPEECAVVPLRSWIKGRCPVRPCPVTVDDAAVFRQQKLVDTAIVADLVWSGSQGGRVIVASDDEDIIPGLLAARAFGIDVGWASRFEKPREPYAGVIARHGIGYIAC